MENNKEANKKCAQLIMIVTSYIKGLATLDCLKNNMLILYNEQAYFRQNNNEASKECTQNNGMKSFSYNLLQRTSPFYIAS